MVGRTIGSRLVELGHDVVMGSRTADHEVGLRWASETGDHASLATFADAAAAGEIIFNCTKGEHALDALKLAGADAIGSKVLIDVTNPLDFSGGFPPTLFVKDTDSLAEQIQREFPNARVVKSLNTMNCEIMVRPDKLDGDHIVFVSGNDDDAKEAVRSLLTQFGWAPDAILELGDLSSARATEMFLPLWLRIYQARQSGNFNVGIVG